MDDSFIDRKSVSVFFFCRRRNEEKQKTELPKPRAHGHHNERWQIGNRIIQNVNYCLYANVYEIRFNLFRLHRVMCNERTYTHTNNLLKVNGLNQRVFPGQQCEL